MDIIGNTAGLNKVQSSLDGVIGKAQALTGILAGAFAFGQIKSFIQEGISFGDQIADSAMRLGLSAEELQKWGYIAERAGLSVESMTKAISFLNKNLGEAQLGTKAAVSTFQKLGINIKNADGSFKGTTDVALEFSDALKRLPTDAQRFAFAQKVMGKGGKEVALVLGQGSDAIREQISLLEQQGGILSGDSAKAADVFSDKTIGIKRAWEVGKTELILKFLPALSKLADLFLAGTQALKQFEKQTGLVTAAFNTLGILMVATGIKVALAWLPAALPFIIIAAEVLALYLIFEDLYYLFTGKGKSAIEELIKKLYGVEKGTDAVNALRAGFNDFLDVLKDIHLILGPIAKLIENFKEGLGIVKVGFVTEGMRPKIPEGLEKTLNFAGDYRATPSPVPYPGRPEFASERTMRFLDAKATQNSMMIPQNIPLSPTAPGQTVNNSNTFNINGGDPMVVKKAIQDALESQLTTTKEDFVTLKQGQ